MCIHLIQEGRKRTRKERTRGSFERGCHDPNQFSPHKSLAIPTGHMCLCSRVTNAAPAFAARTSSRAFPLRFAVRKKEGLRARSTYTSSIKGAGLWWFCNTLLLFVSRHHHYRCIIILQCPKNTTPLVRTCQRSNG